MGGTENLKNSEEDEMKQLLKGKCLAVYYYMLRYNKSLSTREIQRGVGLSSPSLALYHLNNLIQLGLVEQNPQDGYHVVKRVRIGILRFFIGSGRILLPRYTFYSLFFSVLLGSTLLTFGMIFTPIYLLLILILSLVTIIFWYETLEVWKNRPIG